METIQCAYVKCGAMIPVGAGKEHKGRTYCSGDCITGAEHESAMTEMHRQPPVTCCAEHQVEYQFEG